MTAPPAPLWRHSAFAVSFSNLENGVFRAPNYASANLDADPNLVSSIINTSGGHAVLATDFVNRGGQEGEIGDKALQEEVAKDVEQLSYVKFKSSWGAEASTNERGVGVSSSKDGYYRMDLGYIKAVAAIGQFGIVVPRSFVE